MNQEDTFWYWMWSTIALFVTICFVSSLLYFKYTNELMINNGYCETQSIGSSNILLTKCKE